MRSRKTTLPPSLARERGALLGCFLVSRALFYLAGVTFDLRPIDTSWQLLDPMLLRDQLLSSVWYMGGQPPLYNLVMGAFLKLSSDSSMLALLLRSLYAALSLLTCLGLHALLAGMRVPRTPRLACTVLFMVSPALILYENIPYYTLHEIALLTLCALLFQRLLAHATQGRASALFATMAVLVYTRSLFQVYWLIALALFCLVALPQQRRRLLLAVAVPLLLVLALYAKNVAVIGHFGTSHWLGLSAAKLTSLQLPWPERADLVARGQLSAMALRHAYETPERIDDYARKTAHTGQRVLDDGRKSTGHVNYNALPYVAAARDSMHDALYTIKHRPDVYLRSMGRAWLLFMRPASDYPFLKENRDAIAPYSRVYAKLFAGQLTYPEDPQFDYQPGQIGVLLLAGYLVSVVFGLALAVRCLRRWTMDSEDALLLFMWLNVLYVSVIGNAFEMDENQRFRFTIHPLLITMLCAAVRQLLQLRSARAQRARNCSAESPSASIQR